MLSEPLRLRRAGHGPAAQPQCKHLTYMEAPPVEALFVEAPLLRGSTSLSPVEKHFPWKHLSPVEALLVEALGGTSPVEAPSRVEAPLVWKHLPRVEAPLVATPGGAGPRVSPELGRIRHHRQELQVRSQFRETHPMKHLPILDAQVTGSSEARPALPVSLMARRGRVRSVP